MACIHPVGLPQKSSSPTSKQLSLPLCQTSDPLPSQNLQFPSPSTAQIPFLPHNSPSPSTHTHLSLMHLTHTHNRLAEMQQRTHLTLSLFLHLLLYTTPSFSSIPSTDTFVYSCCSQLKYGLGSSYQLNVNSLLTSLLSSSSFITYNNSTFSGQDSSPLYGLYQCRGDVSTPDCYRCVQIAISQIGVLCSGSYGGAIQLQDCFVKYDNASFFGVPDKTMMANKCEPVTSGSCTDLLNRRDEVLTELGSRSGFFEHLCLYDSEEDSEDKARKRAGKRVKRLAITIRSLVITIGSLGGVAYLTILSCSLLRKLRKGPATDSEDEARKRARKRAGKRVKRVAITIRNVTITIGSLGGVTYLTIVTRSLLRKWRNRPPKDSMPGKVPTSSEKGTGPGPDLEPLSDLTLGKVPASSEKGTGPGPNLEPPSDCPPSPPPVSIPPVPMCCTSCYEGHPEHGICTRFGYKRGNYKFSSEEDRPCGIM